MKTINSNQLAVKSGRALLCAIFLFTFSLFSCDDILKPPVSGELPAGYGRVAVSVTGLERTVFPTMPAFVKYEYAFAKVGGPAVPQEPVNGLFTLEVGEWRVIVTAYLTAAAAAPVATGESAPFTVDNGTTGNVEVTLAGSVDPSKTGTFTWSVSYPAGSTISEFTLTDLDGNNPIDLKPTATPATPPFNGTNATVPAGYYYLTIRLVDSAKRETGGSDVVYIYDQLNSVYNKTFAAGAFSYKLINIAAIGGVTAPVADEERVATITETDQYTGTVAWAADPVADGFNADDTFKFGVVYKATITLTPKAGYTLAHVPVNFFTVAGAAATNTAGSGIITAPFSSAKENPDVIWPSGLSPVTYGAVLSSISLAGFTNNPAGTFEWKTPSASVGNAGTRSHSVIFTPTDDTTYNTLTNSVSITVNKATPTAITWPAGLSTTYLQGQTLASDSNLDLSGFTNTGIPGTFDWTYPNDLVGGGPGQNHNVTFTPTDAANYNTVPGSIWVTITVASGVAVNAPSGTPSTWYSIMLSPITTDTSGNSIVGQTVEYARSNAGTTTVNNTTWQESTTFTGLAANTTYRFFARSKSNPNYSAGPTSSPGTQITTLQRAIIGFETYWWVDAENDTIVISGASSDIITVTKGTNVPFTANNAAYSSQRWTVNGEIVATNTNSYTFNTSDKVAGRDYTLGLRVQDGTKYYYKEITVQVRN